jgi:SAM-dependent methyltransferase
LSNSHPEYEQHAKRVFRQKRIENWNRVVAKYDRSRSIGRCYHRLLARYYQFLIPPDSQILELGCGSGELLAALKPSRGVGVDFSIEATRRARGEHPGLLFCVADAQEIPINTRFDVIILSDLVNDLWDVQKVIEELRPLCHARTRVIVNSYNNLWRIPLSIVKRLGLGAFLLEQNWLAPHDIVNLLKLGGFEVIKRWPRILLPLQLAFLSTLANRYLVNLIPFNWFALTNIFIARPLPEESNQIRSSNTDVSVIIPARNESGNIDEIIRRTPDLGRYTELIFVEGHSTDDTYAAIEQAKIRFPGRTIKLYRQTGHGKGDAVRLGFENAKGQILMILDADMTVPPEDLERFLDALITGKGDFINGVRLVYPLEDQAMRSMNILGNKLFSLAFSWLLDQPIKDTLCGTKVLWKRDYQAVAGNRHYFGDFDPFGDFDLLFGAAKLNLKIIELPIRYRSRRYGETNIARWRHGWLLLKMVIFAARRIKFI